MKSLRYKTCVRCGDAPRDRFLTETPELNSRNIAMANSKVNGHTEDILIACVFHAMSSCDNS